MSSSRMTEKIHVLRAEKPAAVAIHDDLDPYLDKIEPTGTDVLVAVYVRPTMKEITDPLGRKIQLDLSAGGSQLDDKYQGKVCLVLKCGPGATSDNLDVAQYFKDGRVPEPGNWVLVMIHNRYQFLMGTEDQTRHVALVAAHNISAVLTDPDCFL
jgi:hypothetical protein